MAFPDVIEQLVVGGVPATTQQRDHSVSVGPRNDRHIDPLRDLASPPELPCRLLYREGRDFETALERIVLRKHRFVFVERVSVVGGVQIQSATRTSSASCSSIKVRPKSRARRRHSEGGGRIDLFPSLKSPFEARHQVPISSFHSAGILPNELPHHLNTARLLQHLHNNPRLRSSSSSPMNVTFSPIITRGIR